MRIQHNISALNSYHKLATNNSNLAKNLEKLSSGYKINRAADDAAGLAISEKMRAQITGLETAQQNSKDGISLVQTAEGALTEVHSMLNRMVALTTQASNGIYEEGERTKIQDELDQLCEEIDRIADATNFNGIKLLDGSMTSEAMKTTATGGIEIPDDDTGAPIGDVGSTAKTILHTQGVDTAVETKFTIDFSTLASKDAAAGEKMKIKLGTTEIELEHDAALEGGTGNVDLTTADGIAAALVDKLTNSKATENVNGNANVTYGDFTITATGSTVKFEQTNAPNDATEVVNANMTVKVESAGAARPGGAAETPTVGGTAVSKVGTSLDGDGAGTAAKFQVEFSGVTVTAPASGTGSKLKLSFAGSDVEINYVDGMDDEAIAAAFVGKTIDIGGVTLTARAGADNTKIIFEAADDTTTTGIAAGTPTLTGVAGSLPGGAGGASGTWSVGTTDTVQGTEVKPGGQASTTFELTKAMSSDGSKLTIGDKTYAFVTDADAQVGANEVKIDMSDCKDLADADYVKEATRRLANATDNSVFTIGTTGDGKTMTLIEKNGQTTADLSTLDNIKAQLSATTVTVTQPPAGAKGLRLQIGDTDDQFNMLDVNVQDCHSKALGISSDDVMRVDNVDAANKAMMAAKAAIETVSATRSKMGAIQNRLDHTLNNLAETTTNLTDAESRIRDTDMAEEMMKYTKNNILIQASQAMLAQANQVPQGVLQLLQ